LDHRPRALDTMILLLHASPTLLPYTALFRSPWRSCMAPELASVVESAPGVVSLLDGLAVLPVQTTEQGGQHLKFSAAPGLYQLRSEEHTSELQSRENLVCRLLLEKKNLNSSL